MKGQEDIANTLREAFAKDPKIRAERITITMLGDAIALSGEVASLAEKDEATFLARQIAPQLDLDNSLTVAGNRLPSDRELQRQAEELIRKEGVPDSLGVVVHRGEATLKGDVESLELRDRAACLVSQVPGMKAVHADGVTLHRRQIVDVIGPERGTLRGKVEIVGPGEPIEVNRPASDIVNDVERRLGDELGRADEIRTTIRGGVVTLTGFVKSAEERAQAEILARSVPGVTEVRNLVVSQDGSAGCNEALAAEIRRKLTEGTHLSPANIKVFVVDDVVYLQGDVDFPEQVMEAQLIARNVPGIAHVDAERLRVTDAHPRPGQGPGRSVAETRSDLVSEGRDWDPSRPEEGR